MIVPTANAFIPEKKLSEDNFTMKFKGHYGAEYHSETLSCDIKFFWGNGEKTYTRKKWLKKLRYIANKGSANKNSQSMTLRSGTNQI